MKDKLMQILDSFNLPSKIIKIEENTQGNINSTYIITCKTKEKYLLQKININVFKDPYSVMKNIYLITEFINKKVKKNNINYRTLSVIKTKDNKLLSIITNENGEKEYYRMYDYIENCISYDTFNDCEDKLSVSYNAGKCFGIFHRLLIDYPISTLTDTIPDFHNTPKRYNDLIVSIQNDVMSRSSEYPEYIVDLITKYKECKVIYDNLGKSIPVRVTHNDTKLNNILFDKNTNESVAIIDLDTIMSGSYLFDIGDGIRSACSSCFEDETDKSKIFLDLDLTKSYLNGYLSEMYDYLTNDELYYISLSIKVLTYELSIRFLTDYLNGDVYFKIKYPKHNSDRFLNQYYLLKDIESKLDEIQDYIDNYR